MLGALSPVFCVSAKKIFLSFISETKRVGGIENEIGLSETEASQKTASVETKDRGRTKIGFTRRRREKEKRTASGSVREKKHF